MSKYGFKSLTWRRVRSIPSERRTTVYTVKLADGTVVNAFTTREMATIAAGPGVEVGELTVWDEKVVK